MGKWEGGPSIYHNLASSFRYPIVGLEAITFAESGLVAVGASMVEQEACHGVYQGESPSLRVARGVQRSEKKRKGARVGRGGTRQRPTTQCPRFRIPGGRGSAIATCFVKRWCRREKGGCVDGCAVGCREML